jgi:hypothetical protein
VYVLSDHYIALLREGHIVCYEGLNKNDNKKVKSKTLELYELVGKNGKLRFVSFEISKPGNSLKNAD